MVVEIGKQLGLFALDIIRLYLLLIILLREPFKSKIKLLAYSIVGLFVCMGNCIFAKKYARKLG